VKIFIAVLISLFFCPLFIMAQTDISNDSIQLDTSKHKIRKEDRKKARNEMTDHFRIGLYGTYAYINSAARFDSPTGILSVNIDLEEHLGLTNEKMIYYGTFIYRITPRSGINGMYYNLNRKTDHILETDIIFLGDTIPEGELVGSFMNTSVLSFGYIFSIIADDRAFLGAFVNFYVAKIKVGVRSEPFEINKSSELFVAAPNIGIVTSFKLKKWMSISGGIGIFFLNTEDWSGSLQDLQITLDFLPAKWLGISAGYQAFDIRGSFPQEKFTANLTYSLHGPTFGVRVTF
jgi:hypothetical protein